MTIGIFERTAKSAKPRLAQPVDIKCRAVPELRPTLQFLVVRTERPLMKVPAAARLVVAILLLTFVAGPKPFLPPPPATPKRPVTDEYQGVKITDDYRWLENWDDPEVKQWSAAQNARSREYLDHLPARPAIRQQIKQAVSASSAAVLRSAISRRRSVRHEIPAAPAAARAGGFAFGR